MERRRRHGRIEQLVAALEAHAETQRGLLTVSEIEAGGISRSVTEARCETGEWRHAARGVIAVGRVDGGPLQRIAAVLLSAPPGAFAHMLSAARIHGGLDVPPFARPEVAVPSSCGSRRFPRRAVPQRHIIEVHDLQTTDGLQTLLDAARVLDDIRWEWALEAALRHRLTTIAEIELALAAPGRKDKASVERVTGVLALRPPGAPPTGSLLETRFIQLCRRFGAPDPVRQLEVVVPGRFLYKIDCSWPDFHVFVELDGKGHQGQPLYDGARQTAIVAEKGWLCGRFSWDEVVYNPRPTWHRLRDLLEQGRRKAAFERAGV